MPVYWIEDSENGTSYPVLLDEDGKEVAYLFYSRQATDEEMVEAAKILQLLLGEIK